MLISICGGILKKQATEEEKNKTFELLEDF